MEIQATIAAGGEQECISSEVVLALVADMARADPLDFVEVDQTGRPRVTLSRARTRGQGYLQRRFRTGKDGTVTLKLEPRLRALAKLGGHY
jgi:hypothetical protein